MRAKVGDILAESEHWDGQVWVLQVIDATPSTMELRALMSAEDAPTAWDLRCEVRERLIGWFQAEHPGTLPRVRLADAEGSRDGDRGLVPPGPGDVRKARSAEAEGVRDLGSAAPHRPGSV